MKKLLFFAALFMAATSFAQQSNGPAYQSAMGAKISNGLAFTYKKFITNKNALEGQAMFFNEAVRFAALYEFHFFNI